MHAVQEKKSDSIIQIDDLKVVVRLFERNWIIFLSFALICGIGSFFYSYRLHNIYLAKTQIILKSNDYNIEAALPNQYSSYEETANQIRVIKSSNLIEEVVEKLKLNVSYYIQGRIKSSEVFQNIPFKVVSENFGTNAFYKDFYFEFVDGNSFKLSFYNESEELIAQQYNFDELILDHGLYFKILKSPAIQSLQKKSIDELAKYKFIIHKNEDIIHKYKSSIQVENEEWTSILNVSVQDEIAERGVMFLDTLSKVYIDYSLKNRFDINQNTYDYINNQLEEVVEILNSIEQEIEVYKESKEILNLDREQEEYFNNLVTAQAEKKKISLKIQAVNDLKNYIIQNQSKEFFPPSYYILQDDDFIQRTTEKLYDTQLKKTNALLQGTSKTFSIESLDNTINQLQKDLLLHLMNTKKFLDLKLVDYDQELETYRSKLKIIPKNQRQLLNIQRKLEVNEKLYLFLLERRAENIISKAGIISDTKVIEKAQSTGIVWPSRSKIIISYVLGGLVAAFLIALIRMLFFQKISSLNDLDENTYLPILGGIPLLKNKDHEYLVVNNNPKGPFSEAFRNIRANLQYLIANKNSKIIMVTSVYPSEGKTFCSINLATILAKANKKVLIIDFDLHKPRLHQGFGMDKKLGLSNYLIGDKQLNDVIQSTPVASLFTILSGPIPPNPSELVLSDKVTEMFQTLSDTFDFIILDTPPLALISDGVILLNKFADLGIFITNTKHSNKNIMKFLEGIAQKNPDKSIGVVLNGIETNKWRYYYGKYEYKYAYSYNYDYSSDSTEY